MAVTYAPYHFVQIYVRAALSEFMAMAWLPWAVLAFLWLWDGPGPRRAAASALVLLALMMFHTVSTLTFVPFIGCLLVLLVLRDWLTARRAGQGFLVVVRSAAVGWTVAALLVAGLLSCIFFVPMLLERGYVAEWQWVNQTYNYRLHFVYPGQFLLPTWGYGYSVDGPNDGMSFQLGIPIVLLAILGCITAIVPALRRRGRLDGPARKVVPGGRAVLFFAVVTVTVLFFMTPAAETLWKVLPLVELIQFPWRLLALTALTLAMLAGLGVFALSGGADRGGRTTPFVYVATFVLILSSLPFTHPQIVPLRPQDESPLAVLDFEMAYPDMRGLTVWSERQPADADSPLIAQYLAGQPLLRAAIVSGAGEIVEQSARALSAEARIRADGPVHMRFYTYYFPGWTGTVDGQPVELRPEGPNGLIGLEAPAGEHEVRVTFGLTPARLAGRLLSAVGVLGLGALFLIGLRRPRIF